MRLATSASLTVCLLGFGGGALADEGGVSFWLPGLYGSLAAVPSQPGFSLATIYYHTSVKAGGNVAAARQFQIGRFTPTLTVDLNARLKGRADLDFTIGSYVFETPVLGGQAAVGLVAIYARSSATLNASSFATLGPFSVFRAASFTDTTYGFGDLYPQASLKWNHGVHNFMWYVTGDIPVGAYKSTRLANIGIGHAALDSGGGYTYFNPETGHEFSAVGGFTYNWTNTSTDYKNGIDFHLDWGASQFLSKQVLVGAVGYLYQQVTGDSGSGDRVGCVQIAGGWHWTASRVHLPGRRRPAGLSESEGLQGVRRAEPTAWLEYLGHAFILAGRENSADRAAKAYNHEICADGGSTAAKQSP